MPELDVNDVLLDPEFADTTLVCVRRTQTIDNHGVASEATTTIPFTGVVTSNAGDTLNVDENGTRIIGSILITTPFNLQMEGQNQGADHVRWNGREYIVDNLQDYSTYGRGFVIATCNLAPVTG